MRLLLPGVSPCFSLFLQARRTSCSVQREVCRAWRNQRGQAVILRWPVTTVYLQRCCSLRHRAGPAVLASNHHLGRRCTSRGATLGWTCAFWAFFLSSTVVSPGCLVRDEEQRGAAGSECRKAAEATCGLGWLVNWLPLVAPHCITPASTRSILRQSDAGSSLNAHSLTLKYLI